MLDNIKRNSSPNQIEVENEQKGDPNYIAYIDINYRLIAGV